jgi:hypothetical protein
VWDFIGTRIRFLDQEIHADFYCVLHGVRVLFYKIRMCPSGDFTWALNTSRAPERFMRILWDGHGARVGFYRNTHEIFVPNSYASSYGV